MCVHNLPLWPALAGLECVWQLAAAGGGWALSSRPGVLPSTGVWSVGVAETRRWPRHQPRDQQEVVTRTRAQHPRPQHRWRRNAPDWHLFRHLSSYAWYAVVYSSKKVQEHGILHPVTDRSLVCYHGYINVRSQWPQTLYLRRPLMVSWFWIEQNYSLKCVAVGFNFYW